MGIENNKTAMPGQNMQFSETKELCKQISKNKQFK